MLRLRSSVLTPHAREFSAIGGRRGGVGAHFRSEGKQCAMRHRLASGLAIEDFAACVARLAAQPAARREGPRAGSSNARKGDVMLTPVWRDRAGDDNSNDPFITAGPASQNPNSSCSILVNINIYRSALLQKANVSLYSSFQE